MAIFTQPTAADAITGKRTVDPTKTLSSKYSAPAEKEIEKLKAQRDTLINFVKNEHGDNAVKFVTKPTTSYDQYDVSIAKMNPQLYQISKDIDLSNLKIQQLENEKMNLEKAQQTMFGALQGQAKSINDATEQRLWSLSQQKEIQKWAVQWMAWAAWAPSGMMSKIQWEIGNQYAPQAAEIEAARQQWLAGVYGQVAAIPSTLAAMQSQNLQNELTRKQIDELGKQNTWSSGMSAYRSAIENAAAWTKTNVETPVWTTQVGDVVYDKNARKVWKIVNGKYVADSQRAIDNMAAMKAAQARPAIQANPEAQKILDRMFAK